MKFSSQDSIVYEISVATYQLHRSPNRMDFIFSTPKWEAGYIPSPDEAVYVYTWTFTAQRDGVLAWGCPNCMGCVVTEAREVPFSSHRIPGFLRTVARGWSQYLSGIRVVPLTGRLPGFCLQNLCIAAALSDLTLEHAVFQSICFLGAN